MGFNTGVLILNDDLYAAEQDKEGFATNLLNAIGEQSRGKPSESVDFRIGNNLNGGSVFLQSHADFTNIVAIGGNYTTHLFTSLSHTHHRIEDKLKLLKELADHLGYRLVCKQKRKPVIK